MIVVLNFFISMIASAANFTFMNLFSTFDGTRKILITEMNIIKLSGTGHSNLVIKLFDMHSMLNIDALELEETNWFRGPIN